jgi:2-C-methyl-D-erythritol 4-phosphate cytidylyltransferase
LSFLGLIPAAGVGARFAGAGGAAGSDKASEVPKQYRTLAQGQSARPMLAHAVRSLLAAPEIDMVFVVLAQEDRLFRELDWGEAAHRVQPLYCGGATRRDSVLNGLVAIAGSVDAEDWILVHDAARPCLPAAALRRLLAAAGPAGKEGEAGAILAVPVADTLKRGEAGGELQGERIIATEPRDGLWQAQTPQMFRHALLMRALLAAAEATDEASAIERLGLRPRLVRGSPLNMKVTVPDDLALAELILGAGADFLMATDGR